MVAEMRTWTGQRRQRGAEKRDNSLNQHDGVSHGSGRLVLKEERGQTVDSGREIRSGG